MVYALDWQLTPRQQPPNLPSSTSLQAHTAFLQPSTLQNPGNLLPGSLLVPDEALARHFQLRSPQQLPMQMPTFLQHQSQHAVQQSGHQLKVHPLPQHLVHSLLLQQRPATSAQLVSADHMTAQSSNSGQLHQPSTGDHPDAALLLRQISGRPSPQLQQAAGSGYTTEALARHDAAQDDISIGRLTDRAFSITTQPSGAFHSEHEKLSSCHATVRPGIMHIAQQVIQRLPVCNRASGQH